MPPEIAWGLYSLATSPQKAYLVLPGNRHGEGFKNATKPYEAAVRTFLASLAKEP
jgi:hypothetical protein